MDSCSADRRAGAAGWVESDVPGVHVRQGAGGRVQQGPGAVRVTSPWSS